MESKNKCWRMIICITSTFLLAFEETMYFYENKENTRNFEKSMPILEL